MHWAPRSREKGDSLGQVVRGLQALWHGEQREEHSLSCKCSKTTVKNVVGRAVNRAGAALSEEMDYVAIRRRLYPKPLQGIKRVPRHKFPAFNGRAKDQTPNTGQMRQPTNQPPPFPSDNCQKPPPNPPKPPFMAGFDTFLKAFCTKSGVGASDNCHILPFRKKIFQTTAKSCHERRFSLLEPKCGPRARHAPK